jgi:hypothetical protein
MDIQKDIIDKYQLPFYLIGIVIAIFILFRLIWLLYKKEISFYSNYKPLWYGISSDFMYYIVGIIVAIYFWPIIPLFFGIAHLIYKIKKK